MTDAPIEVTLDDEAPEPVPENGVARQPSAEPKSPKPEPKHRRRVTDEQRAAFRPPIRPEDPPRDFATGHNPHKPGVTSEKDTWPTKPGPLWLKILDWLRTGGEDGGPQKIGERDASSDDVMIAVERVGGGGGGGAAEFPDPIEGSSVEGNDSESGDTLLMRRVTDSYHVPLSDPRARATFRLRFYWRQGGRGDIKKSEPFTLPSPIDIKRSRAASGEAAAEVTPLSPLGAAAASPGGKDYYHGRLEEKVAALEREAEQARKENRAPRPVEQVMQPAAGGMPADWQRQLDLEKRVAVAEAEKKWLEEKNGLLASHAAKIAELENSLKSLETKAKDDSIAARIQALQDRIEHPPPPPPHEVEARYLAQLVARGIVTTTPDGQPAPMKSVVEGLTLEQAIAQIIQDPATYSKLQAAYQRYRDTVRSVHGFEEPRTEIVPSEPEEPEEPKGVWGMAKDWIGKNGDVLLAMGLEGVDQAAGAVLVPSAAASVKGVVAMGKEQLKRKAEGAAPRAAPPPPGWKPPSV